MILVDTALERAEAAGTPVRVGLIGAGYMGRGIARRLLTPMRGMRLAAIANRTAERAARAYTDAGAPAPDRAASVAALERAVARAHPAVTDDPEHLCAAEGIDVVIEATGDVELGARVALAAARHGKHVVLMNAEVDATVGPILKVHADRAGVVLTNADGDQPGVLMNLLRWVRALGCRPVLAGNVKGMWDPYRTPETQAAFAAEHGQSVRMATSFADGTKLAMEMAVVANATGYAVPERGMRGPRCARVEDAARLFPQGTLAGAGEVDYVLGAEPGPGVFVLAREDDPERRRYLRYLKLGEGPVYTFYTPCHLPHLEVPLTAARAALFRDAAIAPHGAPVAEVVAVAKRDLRAGEVLDGIGGFTVYGTLEPAEAARRDDLLPMGVADGGTLLRDLPRGHALARSDVSLPAGRLVDRLRAEQDAHFSAVPAAAAG